MFECERQIPHYQSSIFSKKPQSFVKEVTEFFFNHGTEEKKIFLIK